MMRARWLKPEFFTDRKVAALGPIPALVYQALWCMADDGGTAQCDPDTIKARMFYLWSSVGVPEITEAVRHLSTAGRIVRYRVGDDAYATLPTWERHQKVHKPSGFRYPDMTQGVSLGVPEECGTSEAPLPASPPPRHLDTYTPRYQDSKVTTLASPVEKKARTTWLTPYAVAWKDTYGGDPVAGQLVKALAPVRKEHGDEEALRRWGNYLRGTEAPYANPFKFASTWGQWDTGKSDPRQADYEQAARDADAGGYVL